MAVSSTPSPTRIALRRTRLCRYASIRQQSQFAQPTAPSMNGASSAVDLSEWFLQGRGIDVAPVRWRRLLERKRRRRPEARDAGVLDACALPVVHQPCKTSDVATIDRIPKPRHVLHRARSVPSVRPAFDPTATSRPSAVELFEFAEREVGKNDVLIGRCPSAMRRARFEVTVSTILLTRIDLPERVNRRSKNSIQETQLELIVVNICILAQYVNVCCYSWKYITV